jgi:uncharacterized CHY-type Zn-finger protein
MKDIGHLVRVALLMIVCVLVFVVVRRVVEPAGFGKYGHYRAGALDDIRSHPIAFAGHAACESCHSDVLEIKSKTKHAGVACEACHGAQAKHAADPASIKPVLPDTAVLCVRCHEANSAKPKTFPQVNASEHSGGQSCGTCHQPHSPRIGG